MAAKAVSLNCWFDSVTGPKPSVTNSAVEASVVWQSPRLCVWQKFNTSCCTLPSRLFSSPLTSHMGAPAAGDAGAGDGAGEGEGTLAGALGCSSAGAGDGAGEALGSAAGAGDGAGEALGSSAGAGDGAGEALGSAAGAGDGAGEALGSAAGAGDGAGEALGSSAGAGDGAGEALGASTACCCTASSVVESPFSSMRRGLAAVLVNTAAGVEWRRGVGAGPRERAFADRHLEV
jgi:hypothetical protein